MTTNHTESQRNIRIDVTGGDDTGKSHIAAFIAKALADAFKKNGDLVSVDVVCAEHNYADITRNVADGLPVIAGLDKVTVVDVNAPLVPLDADRWSYYGNVFPDDANG